MSDINKYVWFMLKYNIKHCLFAVCDWNGLSDKNIWCFISISLNYTIFYNENNVNIDIYKITFKIILRGFIKNNLLYKVYFVHISIKRLILLIFGHFTLLFSAWKVQNIAWNVEIAYKTTYKNHLAHKSYAFVHIV